MGRFGGRISDYKFNAFFYAGRWKLGKRIGRGAKCIAYLDHNLYLSPLRNLTSSMMSFVFNRVILFIIRDVNEKLTYSFFGTGFTDCTDFFVFC